MAEEANREDKSDDGRKKVRRWTSDEHNKLLELVLAAGDDIKWPPIAEALNTGRTAKQCRERYLNARPENKKGSWTTEEETLIARLHSEMGPTWSKIARQLPGRNENDTKNHWNAMLRCKTLDNRMDTVIGCYARLIRDGAQALPATFTEACRLCELNNRIKGSTTTLPASSAWGPPHSPPHQLDDDDGVHLDDDLHASIRILAQQPLVSGLSQQQQHEQQQQQQQEQQQHHHHQQQQQQQQRRSLTPMLAAPQHQTPQAYMEQQTQVRGMLALLHHSLHEAADATQQQPQLQLQLQHMQMQMQMQVQPQQHMQMQRRQQQQQQEGPMHNVDVADMQQQPTRSSASSNPRDIACVETHLHGSCISLEAAMQKARQDAWTRLTCTPRSQSPHNMFTASLISAAAGRTPSPGVPAMINPTMTTNLASFTNNLTATSGLANPTYEQQGIVSAPNSAHSTATQITSHAQELVHPQPLATDVLRPDFGLVSDVGPVMPTGFSSVSNMAAALRAMPAAQISQQAVPEAMRLQCSGHSCGQGMGAGWGGVGTGMEKTVSRVRHANMSIAKAATPLQGPQVSMPLSTLFNLQGDVQGSMQGPSHVPGWQCDAGMLRELELSNPQGLPEAGGRCAACLLAAAARRPALKRWFSDLEAATSAAQAHKLIRGPVSAAAAAVNNSNSGFLPLRPLSECGVLADTSAGLTLRGNDNVTAAVDACVTQQGVTPQLRMPATASSMGSAQFAHALSQLELGLNSANQGHPCPAPQQALPNPNLITHNPQAQLLLPSSAPGFGMPLGLPGPSAAPMSASLAQHPTACSRLQWDDRLGPP